MSFNNIWSSIVYVGEENRQIYEIQDSIIKEIEKEFPEQFWIFNNILGYYNFYNIRSKIYKEIKNAKESYLVFWIPNVSDCMSQNYTYKWYLRQLILLCRAFNKKLIVPDFYNYIKEEFTHYKEDLLDLKTEFPLWIYSIPISLNCYSESQISQIKIGEEFMKVLKKIHVGE